MAKSYKLRIPRSAAWIGILLSVAILGGMSWLLNGHIRTTQRLSATTTGVVRNVKQYTERTGSTNGGYRTYYYTSIDFSVNNTDYYLSEELSSRRAVNSSIAVLYNPSDPSDASTKETTGRAIVVSSIFVAVLCIFVLCSVIKKLQ